MRAAKTVDSRPNEYFIQVYQPLEFVLDIVDTEVVSRPDVVVKLPSGVFDTE